MSSSGDQGNGRQSATDAEFRATFSLLPFLNTLLTCLSQGDAAAVEKTVSELDSQLRRCQLLLNNSSYLTLSEEEQKHLLSTKRRELQKKRELLMMYSDLSALTSR